MTATTLSHHCGIDFGTTNSSVSVIGQDGRPQVLDIDLQNPENPKILRSLIYLNPQGKVETGQMAINQYLWDITNIPSRPPRIVSTGRFIKTFGPSTPGGAGPPIIVPEVIEIDDSGRGRLLQSLKSVLTSDTFKGTTLFGRFYSLEDLIGMLLTQIRLRAQNSLERDLDSVTLGRPVRYVGDREKEKLALSRMGQIARNAGFKQIRFEYEPVGAALNFGIGKHQPETVFVFDFGGGTLDTCIIQLPEKKVLSVSGRPIGGDLVNSCLVTDFLLSFFGKNVVISDRLEFPNYYLHAVSRNWYQTTLSKNVSFLESIQSYIPKADNPQPLINLKNLIVNDYGFDFFHSVDQTKILLSDHSQVNYSFIRPELELRTAISRKAFENSLHDLLEDTQKCLRETLALAGLKASDITQVMLTGGSSKIPVFQNQLHQLFSSQPFFNANPFTSVAQGLVLSLDN